MAGLTSKQRWQIRRIFLQRRKEYSPTDAAKLLGMTRSEVIDGIKSGEIDAREIEHVEYRLRWRTIAVLAIIKWPEEALYEALGKEADDVFPPLRRLETLTVRIPAFAVRMLEFHAKRTGITVDEYLRGLLQDDADSARSLFPDIEAAIPGFRDAVMFPD